MFPDEFHQLRAGLLCALLLFCSAQVLATGEFRWQADVATQSLYNENWILADPDDQDLSATAFRGQVTLRSRYETALNLFEMSARYGQQEFDNDLLPDIDDLQLTGSWLRRQEYGGLSFRMQYDDRAALLSAFDQEGLVDVDDDEKRYQASLTKYRELSEVSLVSVFLQAQRYQFRDQGSGVQRPDSNLYSAVASYDRQLSESTTVSVQLAADWIENELSFPFVVFPFVLEGTSRTESQIYGPALGLTRDLGHRWRLSTNISYRRRVDQSSFSSVLGSEETTARDWDYYGSAGIERSGERSEFKLEVTRLFRPTQSNAVQLTIRDALTGSYRYRLRESLSLGVSAAAFLDDQQGELENQRTAWQSSLSLTWQARNRWFASAYVSYQTQRNEFALSDISVDRYAAGLTLTRRFGLLN